MRLLVVALVGVSAPVSAGPCAIHPLVPTVKTVNDTLVPGDGGVLVGLSDSGLWDQPSNPEIGKTKWRFVDGGKEIEPVIRVIAPGLAVYAPPPGSTPIKLVDAKRTLVTVRRTADAKAALPAPTVKGVVHTHHASPPGPRSFSRTAVTAQLTGPRPDGAVAIILFNGKAPVSWVTAFSYEGPAGNLEVFHTPGRCETSVPGLTESPPGARVTLAWVDASGRIGTPSKEVVVVKGKPGPTGGL